MRLFRDWLLILTLAGSLGCGTRTDSGGPMPPEKADYDVFFYDVHVAVSPEFHFISGTVTMHATVTDTLQAALFDLDHHLTITGVSLDGKPASYSHKDGQVRIEFDFERLPAQSFQIQTTYEGRPVEASDPPWDGGFTWSRSKNGSPWFATSNQLDGPDLWWPAKDHPSDKPDSLAIRITVPEGIIAVSNGRLVDTTIGDSTSTFHWFVSTPISAYNVSIAAGDFEKISYAYTRVSGDSLPLEFWVLPERTDDATRQLTKFAQHLAWFEELLGPYPFRGDKYGVVHVPFLGMEHQSIIAYGADFVDSYFGFDELHHHELAHEWFGNLVTVSDWKDFWLHEGFAEYLQPLYVEHLRGKQSFKSAMADKRRFVSDEYVLAPEESRSAREMYGNDVYHKGAWVLHTLRHVVGDSTFLRLLRKFAYPDSLLESTMDGAAARYVTSRDFEVLVERTSGQELSWFFDQYLRMPDLPRLEVREGPTRLEIRWETARRNPFPKPLEVEINGKLMRVEMPEGQAVIDLPEGSSWKLDPDNWILKKQ